MNQATQSPSITLRIPGDWSHPGELLERLPPGFVWVPRFWLCRTARRSSLTPCRRTINLPGFSSRLAAGPPRVTNRPSVARYSVNIGLTGPGGSLESALIMMQAARRSSERAARRSIDNSALAHGGEPGSN